MSGVESNMWRWLADAHEMPYGSAQIAAVERLMRQADTAGDPHFAFATRMLATTAYVYGGEPAKSLVTFSWCLADFDGEPQPYHERFAHSLMWHFKYMANVVLIFPEVPLAKAHAVLDDMERRYQKIGQSLQPVYKKRFQLAGHVGNHEEAEEWYRRWITAERGDLSDCAGCDPSAQVRHLDRTGRHEEAVAAAAPVLDGRFTCSEQPQSILTNLLMPYVHTGRLDAARDAHRRAYRLIRGRLADLGDIGDHLAFCALTSNPVRGLEILERHLEWLDRAPSPSAALQFTTGAAMVLQQLDADGRGDLTVHRRAHGDRPATDVPVSDLAAELIEVATDIARRFDVRNGGTSHSDGLAHRLAAEPVVTDLPLSASRRRSTGTPRAVEPKMPAVPADATPEQLLELAEEAWRTDRTDELTVLLRTYDKRFDAQDVPPLAAARRTELRVVELEQDPAAALASCEDALRRYRELGDRVREHIVAGRLGVLMGSLDEENQPAGLELVTTAVEVLTEIGDPAQRAGAYNRLASALGQHGRWAEALAAVERAEHELVGEREPHLRVMLAVRRTECLEQLDKQEELRAAAQTARDMSRSLGMPRMLAVASLAYARSVEDNAEALAACDEAVSVVTGPFTLPTRLSRARLLMSMDRAGDAVEDFVEAVALCVERGITDGGALLRWELAEAYRRAGRPAEAVEVAEEAVTELDRLGRQAEADQCRHMLAHLYLALDEDRPALALLDQLAENLDGPDNLAARGQVLEEAGAVLYDRDRDALAAQRFAAAATAYQLAGLPVDELRSRRREAAALLWADEADAGLSAIERADRIADELPADTSRQPAVIWEVAMLADAAARVLLALDRCEDALHRLIGVPERLREIDAFGEALQVELLTGELLLRIGRPSQAEPVLRQVLGALPTTSGAVNRTAWLLARTLAELGRTAEADEVRARYQLDEAE